MTSALLVRRRGHTFEIIEGPIQIGAAITKWKAAVNADVAAPAAEGVANPDAIEVLALQTVRSHKLRGCSPIQTTAPVVPADPSQDGSAVTAESAPPPGPADTAQEEGGEQAAEPSVTEAPTDSELPPAEPPPADPPRGRRKG